MFDVKFDQMKITANTLIEPGKSPLSVEADEDNPQGPQEAVGPGVQRVIVKDGFWQKLKKKFSKK